MSYLDMITIDGPSGTVAIKPDEAVVVWRQGNTADIQLTTGMRIAVSVPAEDAATALWGFRSGTDNGFFNDRHVVAVVPNGGGSRLLMTGGVNLDNPMPVNNMIMTLRRIEAERSRLRSQQD